MIHLEEIDFNQPDFGDFYDELPLWSAPFGLLLLDRVPVRQGMTVLDVGAGTGFLTLELAQRCGPSTTVIAVDPWPAGMKRLRQKVERLGLNNVRLIEQDAAELDLPDGSVDLIVSNLGINNFTNVDAVLGTCRRLLRPSGQLLLTTNLTGHMQELYDVYRTVLVDLDLQDRLPGFDAHVAHRGTVESVSQLLRGAGFEVGEVVNESFRLRFADGSALLRHFFIRLGFVGGWKAIVGSDPELLRRVFAELERRLNLAAAKRGELALTVPIACFASTPVNQRRAADEDR